MTKTRDPMIDCPSCGAQVSRAASSCPTCGHPLRKPRRGFFGSLFKGLFIVFNGAMVIWLVGYMISIGELLDSTTSDAEQAGAAVGGTLGVGLLVLFWALGSVILGLLTIITRPSR